MKAPALTFRARVTLLLSGVIVLLGVIAVLRARQDMMRILSSELENRGAAIARDLAANSTDLLLTTDLVGLYDLANRTKINNPDVRYILIAGQAGELHVNTFGERLPRGLLEANVVAPGQPAQLRRLRTEEGLIRDVAVPIFGGRAGVVRVGMSDHTVQAAIAQNSRTLMILVIVAVALGLLTSYWLSYLLTRPLSRLLAAVQSVARGDLTQRIASPSRDEVGQLGRAFNVMAHELESKEAARRELMEKVISSQEEERRRVARELHDELAQQLTSVLFSLEALDGSWPDADQKVKQGIRRARQVTERSLAETRKLIWDLRPTVLDDLGLLPAIRSYAESHLRPLDTEVVVSGTNVPESLPPAVDIAVFRIAQEAINNIAKHARAKRARIDMSVNQGMLTGEVSDDGRGFQQARLRSDGGQQGSCLGIRGMEERAALLGGTLSVSSAPGRGTTVSFAIPLRGGDGHG